MAQAKDPINLTEAWTRLNEANVRYYTDYARLVRNYANDVVGTLKSVRRKTDTESVGAAREESASVFSARAKAFQREPATPPVVALEGALGASPTGLFAVTNDRDEKVSAPIEVSKLTAPDGTELVVAIAFEPSQIDLEPGAQMLIDVTADIESSLELGIPYRADVSVPGLPGWSIELVVRRRPGK